MSRGAAYRRQGRLDGRCVCGGVRLKVDGGYEAAVGACHCERCRIWSGTVLMGFDVDHGALSVEGEVATYATSSFAERAFCPRCGTHLWFRDIEEGAPWEMAPGAFPAAANFPLVSEVYVDRAPAWAAFAGDHRRMTQAEYEARSPHVDGDLP